jgi:O-antigen/teichoic acid export membrane protein
MFKISKFRNSTTFSNFFYLVSIQGINYLIPFILLPYLLKTLGPDKFGMIAFCQAVIQYFILVVDYGFNLTATKKISINRGNQEALNKIFVSTIAAKSILCVFCFLIYIILLVSLPMFWKYRQILNILMFTVVGTVLFPVWFFQGLEKMKLLSIVNFVVKLLLFPITIWLVKQPDDYLIAVILQSIVFLIAGILSLIIIFKYGFVKLIKVNFGDILNEFKFGWNVFISTVASNLYTTSFVIILGLYSSNTVVGYYVAAEKIMRIACFILIGPAIQSLFPKISALAVNNPIHASQLFRKTFFVTSILLVFISLGLYLFSEQITSFLGAKYIQSTYLLKILSVTPIFIGLGGILGQVAILAFEDGKNFSKVYLISGGVSILLVFFLTNAYKEIGTAIALVLTEFSVFILMLNYGYKYLQIRPKQSNE